MNIWPLPFIIRCSSYLNLFWLITICNQNVFYKIYSTLNYSYPIKLLILREVKHLIVKLKLQAFCALKLDPVANGLIEVLPRPV